MDGRSSTGILTLGLCQDMAGTRDCSEAEGDVGKVSCWKPAPSVNTERQQGQACELQELWGNWGRAWPETEQRLLERPDHGAAHSDRVYTTWHVFPVITGEGQHILWHRERKGKTDHREAHKPVCILTLEYTLQKLQWRQKLRWRNEAEETKWGSLDLVWRV